MPKKPRTLDLNENAFRVMRAATEKHDTEAVKRPAKKKPKKKNAAAVALGRLGGLKGGHARAEKLSAKELSEQGKKAAEARWGKTDKP